MMRWRALRRPTRRDQAKRWSGPLRGAAVTVAIIGTLGSVLAAQAWQATVHRQRDERLDRGAASRTVTISGVLVNYENALQAAHSLWLASEGVNRSEFNAFARSLDLRDRYPGLQGIGWRTPVTDAERDGFVARARKEEPTFTIRPSGRRPVYYVTLYSYPRIPSSSSLGADARAIPSVLVALEQARDTARPTLSHQTTLAGDVDLPERQRPVAFELFVPVYGADDPGDSAASRRKWFLGWATGQFRAADFLEAALNTSLPTTGVELHDRSVGEGSLVASWPSGFRAVGPDVREETLVYGGRSFGLRYAPLPGNAILTERTIPSWVVLGGGTAVSILLGALLWLLAQVGALYREVRRLARTDALTGVANRRAWEEEFSRELARAARSGQPLCIALLDLDHFKAYNDQHGHPAGDRLLRAATAAWQGRLRKTDLLARYGGEEFAVLLPDCELDSAMEIAERLRTAQPEGTCSLGVAGWDGRENAAALVDRADRALYAAKQGGRNRSCADRAADAPSPASSPAS
jgi:diguanylate cyclase (GGDEF)-like protein